MLPVAITANELIRRALRLINIPGRGATLTSDDTQSALVTLQEIVNSESVSKMFVPGIRRHFFPMQQGKAIYSYGRSAQADLRSDDFDGDPAPVRIEDAYIREGSNIVDNERVDNFRFENIGTWITTGGASIVNNQAALVDVSNLSQALALTLNTVYTLRLTIDVNISGCQLLLQQNAVDIINVVLDSSGVYDFDFTFTDSLATIAFITAAGQDITLADVSIIERGKPRLELPDSQGSDYDITVVDQRRYNRRFTKGTGGRPYEILYSRNFPVSEIRFDNSAVTGDILVLDVLVNHVEVDDKNSIIRLHDDAIKWLRYELADCMAGEYGKTITQKQDNIKYEAWNKLASGNRRINNMGVDAALRDRPTFDINRGDP